MDIIDIYNLEHSRTSDNSNEIYLIKEGDWFGLYEWSAILAQLVDNGLKDSQKLKMTKLKHNKVNDYVLKCGFPVRSLEKYLPSANLEVINKEKYFILKNKDFKLISFEEIINYINNCKNNIKVIIKNKSTLTEKGVIDLIKQFPVESKSPIESISFLAKLKTAIIENNL